MEDTCIKVVFDNNVVIDALKPNPEFETEAKKVFKAIGNGKISAYLCANSLTDIFYILKKVQGSEGAKNSLSNLMAVFSIIPLTESDCAEALSSPIKDFEDAVIAACTRKTAANCIVSRDKVFIKAQTPVEVITPKQLLEKID
jgi:predicted nucleic acid-binding protein